MSNIYATKQKRKPKMLEFFFSNLILAQLVRTKSEKSQLTSIEMKTDVE
jgi:hypothetical protein